MTRVFFSCYIVILSVFVEKLNCQNADLGTVIFANIIYRHGDRTPWISFATDKYGNESMWSAPFGELTNIGKTQHLQLGRWLRQRYQYLISDKYDRSEVYVESTDFDRTLMSAAANLAGLYPPKGDQVWSPSLNWMPIPIHTKPVQYCSIFAANVNCPRYSEEFKKMWSSPEVRKIYWDNRAFFNFLSENSGNRITNVARLFLLYDTLHIQETHKKILPAWATVENLEKMKKLAALYFQISLGNDKLKRLKMGPFLGEMLRNMVEKSKKTLVPDRKLWIYSAHDQTLANILMALNVYDGLLVPYAATVLLELRKTWKNEYVVTVSYKKLGTTAELLTIPGCTTACPLDKFVEIIKPLIPTDWAAECGITECDAQL